MSAAEIPAVLGGSRRAGQWWRCVCPVHGSRTGRSLSLALRDHPRGLALRCHAGCSRAEIIAELHRRGLIAGETNERDRRPEPSVHARRREREARELARRIEAARAIWNAARSAQGSPVVAYLAGRGITSTYQLRFATRPLCAVWTAAAGRR
jgi:hypothetical protein